jgi:N utilization substance protein A
MYLGSNEIINIVDALARDKGISKEHLIVGIEKAIEEVGRKKYGNTNLIRAKLNRKTGEITLYRVLEVVESLEDYSSQILLQDAHKHDISLGIGDNFYDILPPVDLGRNEAMVARYAITSAVKSAERDKEYDDFIGRVGEIITGVVKRVEFGHVIVDLGRTEALLKRDQLIPNDKFKIGDRVKSYVQDVRREDHGSQIFLSRTNDRMLSKLFEMEVPEIYDGLVEIKAVARDPGSKSKIAVFAVDSNTDAVACCVGIRGARVKSIMEELSGEKIDVISWNNDISKYVVNALSVSNVIKVLVDNELNKVEVVIPQDQLSSAIGRGGQNVKLASKITKCNIDVLTDEKESKRRLEEFHSVSQILIQELDLDETLGQFLVAKGFLSVEQIANTKLEDLMKIEGFDEDLATELNERASECIQNKQAAITKAINDLGVEESLIEFLNFIELKTILYMAERGIKSLEDLALVTYEDLKKMLPRNSVSDQNIVAIIEEAKARTAASEDFR